MLFRRRVITSAPEREVVVVKPRRPTGLYVALGAGTLFAMGLIAYLSYALPNSDRDQYETTAVIVDDRTDGRAQRMRNEDNAAPRPNTVIVNPPPVIQTPPPVIQTSPPVVVKPPERTIIVEGDTRPAPDAPRQNRTNDTSNTTNNDTTNNDDTTNDGDGGDVDGTVTGDR